MTNYQFRKSLAVGMAKLGYEKVISEIYDVHFIKRLNNGFYIAVCLYSHRFEKGAYTAEFHLDYYASFGFFGGDPWLCPRVGEFLSRDERKELINFDSEKINNFGNDFWWYRTDEDSVFYFLKVIELTEDRFLKSNNIFDKVLNNKKILLAYFRLLEIEQLVMNKIKIDEVLIFQPSKEKYDIAPIWYQICEIYQREKQKIKPSRSTVVHQAVSAYRNYIFEQRYGKPPFFDELLARYNKLLEDEKFK